MYLVFLVQTNLHPLPRECLIFSHHRTHTPFLRADEGRLGRDAVEIGAGCFCLAAVSCESRRGSQRHFHLRPAPTYGGRFRKTMIRFY